MVLLYSFLGKTFFDVLRTPLSKFGWKSKEKRNVEHREERKMIWSKAIFDPITFDFFLIFNFLFREKNII